MTFRSIIVLVWLFTILPSGLAQQQPSELILTGTQIYASAGGTDASNTYWGCTYMYELNNNTPNHLDYLSIQIAPFETIAIRDVRAFSWVKGSTSASTSCADAFRQGKAKGAFVGHCRMETVREGDCLKMIKFSTKIPPGAPQKADAEALASCLSQAKLGQNLERCANNLFPDSYWLDADQEKLLVERCGERWYPKACPQP